MMIVEQGYINELIEMLKDGQTSAERAGAARGLGHIGGAEAVAALSNAAQEGNTTEVRTAAAEALGLAIVNSRPKGR